MRLALVVVPIRLLSMRNYAVRVGKCRGSINLEFNQCTSCGKGLNYALVDDARIDGASKFRNVAERPAFDARGADMIHGLTPDIADGREGIAYGGIARQEAGL